MVAASDPSYMIFAADFASIIPISAFGHANTMSAPMDLLFMTTYALPYALPTTTFTFGTVAFAKAAVRAAAFLAMVLSEHLVALNPVTFVMVSTGMQKASQKFTKSAAFLDPLALKVPSIFSFTVPSSP